MLYSRNWLSNLANEKIDNKDFDKNWLDLQGFEVATETAIGDDEIVDLEIKANRPDMLSHLGVLREYYAYKNKGCLPAINSNLNISNLNNFPLKVSVDTKDIDNLILLEITNVNNKISLPKEITTLLENFGLKSISLIVDLSNYLMLEMGQPIHIYDRDKLNNSIILCNSDKVEKITSLNGDIVEIPEGSILVKDDKKTICLAGIVGTKDVEVDENTKNIIIEAAHFDAVKIRIASQKTHITTLSSYRFERGVDSDNTMNGALLCAEKIIELCGGKLNSCFKLLNKKETITHKVSIPKTNRILGIEIKADKAKQLLESYYYQVEILDENNILVQCPRYRVDLEQEIDVIADIGQIYGYHNIPATTVNLSVKYEPNQFIQYSDILRNLMLGQGLNECISYTFIHANSMKMMDIEKDSKLYGDIKILNPLSNKFVVMRPNMIYSMLSTYIYNISKNKECEPIFEIGTTFFKDNSKDTGYNQKNMLAVLLNGDRIPKGFGVDKNIPYDFYDIKAILELIKNEFSQNIEIRLGKEKVFENGRGTDIFIGNKCVGVLGTLSNKILKNFENGKLIKGDVQYFEICIDDLKMGSTPIKETNKYPSIIREYNFLVKNGLRYEDYTKDIKDLNDSIKNIVIKDIYKGKGVAENYISVLISIEYFSNEKTLTQLEVEDIENKMYKILKEKYKIELKL